MKKPLIVEIVLGTLAGIILALAVCTSQTGCTTTSTVSTNTTTGVVTTNTTVTLDLAATTNAINVIVPLGVSFAVSKDTNAIPFLKESVLAIDTFTAGSGTNGLTPAALDAVLLANNVQPSAQTLAVINSVVSLYASAYAGVVEQKLSQVKYLVPILQALAGAISAGLPQ